MVEDSNNYSINEGREQLGEADVGRQMIDGEAAGAVVEDRQQRRQQLLLREEVRNLCDKLRSDDPELRTLDLAALFHNNDDAASYTTATLWSTLADIVSALARNSTVVHINLSHAALLLQMNATENGTAVTGAVNDDGGASSSSLSASVAAEAVKRLVDVLSNKVMLGHPTIREISLCSNSLSDMSSIGRALANASRDSTTLTSLNLFDNSINDEGARELAKMLKVNRSLTKLDLFNNEIGDDGCAAIADALRRNTSLASLDLRWNVITERGANAIERAIRESNYALQDIHLGGNCGVSAKHRRRIQHLCDVSQKIRQQHKHIETHRNALALEVWPNALQTVSVKPGLLCGVLKSKPELLLFGGGVGSCAVGCAAGRQQTSTNTNDYAGAATASRDERNEEVMDVDN